MARVYTKPGVEITQIQNSQTPILATPELEACIVGHAFYWQDISSESSIASTKYTTGTQYTLALSGINANYYDVTGDEDLVIIDLFGVSGAGTGNSYHLVNGTDFTVNNNTVTINANITSTTVATGTYLVKVGFRAKKPVLNKFNVIESASDIELILGPSVSWNPLAYGATLAMMNSNNTINILSLSASGITETQCIDAINNDLATHDVYVIAPMTHKIDPSSLVIHCNNMSSPTVKKERIALVNKEVSYGDIIYNLDATERANIATSIRDTNSAYGSKRLFSIHPDLAYTVETRHVSTIYQSWINNSFDPFMDKDFISLGIYAKLISDLVIPSTGKKYKAGTDLTDQVLNELIAGGWGGSDGKVTVLAPVPGFYYCAQLAGLIIGTHPSQPLTNSTVVGLSRTIGSWDLFTETNLNTMASGGTLIMTQNSYSNPIYIRHQLSTDITSIAKQELSITKALDYTAKFIRETLSPYIGKYNINANFIKLINSILTGIKRVLVTNGVINDMSVLSIKQDDINPDTILIEINILPVYPVNYIKITLLF